MQGDGGKSKEPESLQAVVQTGRLGFYPLNHFALSALAHQQAYCVMGSRDDTLATTLRQQAEFKVGEQTLAIQGKIFGGLSDAFYRGKLPEVVVVAPDMLDIPEFIEELMDFLEKLCSLGFLSQADEDDIELLDRFVPQWAIASYGMVFDVILQKFKQGIQNMGGLTARQKERLVQKFSRALFTSPTGGYFHPPKTLHVWDTPIALKLAGPKSFYTVQTARLMEAHAIECQFNPNGELGILEWELHLGYAHVRDALFPALQAQGIAPAFSMTQWAGWLEHLGQGLDMLPGLVTLDATFRSPDTASSPSLSTSDLAILYRLKLLAESARQSALAEALISLIQVTQPLAVTTDGSSMSTVES